MTGCLWSYNRLYISGSLKLTQRKLPNSDVSILHHVTSGRLLPYKLELVDEGFCAQVFSVLVLHSLYAVDITEEHTAVVIRVAGVGHLIRIGGGCSVDAHIVREYAFKHTTRIAGLDIDDHL